MPQGYETPEEAIPQGTEEPQEQAQQGPNLDALLSLTNIATEMDEELLTKIGTEVYDGYKLDC